MRGEQLIRSPNILEYERKNIRSCKPKDLKDFEFKQKTRGFRRLINKTN